MNHRLILPALCALATVSTLSACTEGYGAGVGWGPEPYAYEGYYDGYYGPIQDGYWGDDGVFWYRSSDHDRHYRRGDVQHFRHDMPGANPSTSGRPYQHFQGNIASPPPGTRMPHFHREQH